MDEVIEIIRATNPTYRIRKHQFYLREHYTIQRKHRFLFWIYWKVLDMNGQEDYCATKYYTLEAAKDKVKEFLYGERITVVLIV